MATNDDATVAQAAAVVERIRTGFETVRCAPQLARRRSRVFLTLDVFPYLFANCDPG